MTDEIAGRTPADAGESPGDGLEALTEDVLPALIARLRASRLGELEVRTDGWRIRLRRDPSARTRSAAAAGSAAGEEEAEGLDGSVARSPGVGYFKPAPELVVGRSVHAGDLLGVIDVLGIVHEVSAPEDGIIATVLAEDGQAVEYGQAIAEIDPLAVDLADDDEGEVA